MNKKLLIGFIGQGFVGKNLADNFEERGYKIIRFPLDQEYKDNKDLISKCDIVFIAVPTPSTPKGFDYSIIMKVLPIVGKGKIAVIKSTILPGTTKKIQKKFKNIYVMHSPEFLTEANARYETDNPERNIIGITQDIPKYHNKAKTVMVVLPRAHYELICTSEEAEFVKYGGNNFLYSKIVFVNILHDYCVNMGADWDKVSSAMVHDPRIGRSHMKPLHKTSGKMGRGAGGHCFIKDFEAFLKGYRGASPKDRYGIKVLEFMRDKNLDLLVSSGKDMDLLHGVYGSNILKKNKKR